MPRSTESTATIASARLLGSPAAEFQIVIGGLLLLALRLLQVLHYLGSQVHKTLVDVVGCLDRGLKEQHVLLLSQFLGLLRGYAFLRFQI